MGCDTTSVEAPVLRTNLNAPALRSPLDGQDRRVGPLVFQWQAVDNVQFYDVEVQRAGAAPAVLRTAETSISLTLDQAGRYTWRVRTRDALDQAGYWSERRTLSIE